MQPVHRKRLKKLADFLSKFKPSDNRVFDMDTWGHNEIDDIENSVVKNKTENKVEVCTEFKCSTTACALGWAATIPELNKEGLHWESCISSYDIPEVGDQTWSGIALEGYKNRDEIRIAMRFFGLKASEAVGIFGGSDHYSPSASSEGYEGESRDVEPKEVADRITSLLAGKWTPSAYDKRYARQYR